MSYKGNEHLYHWMKALDPGDATTAEDIHMSATGSDAKLKAKRLKTSLTGEWHQKRLM